MAVHPGCGLPALHRGDDIQPIRLILGDITTSGFPRLETVTGVPLATTSSPTQHGEASL